MALIHDLTAGAGADGRLHGPARSSKPEISQVSPSADEGLQVMVLKHDSTSGDSADERVHGLEFGAHGRSSPRLRLLSCSLSHSGFLAHRSQVQMLDMF